MTLNARAIMTRAAAALWLAATLYETQRPLGWMTPVPFWAVFTATMAGVDLVQNIVLFLPMGWIARRAGWSLRRTLLAGAVVSVIIEVGQVWVAGRTSTAMDIVCNTAGAVLGWWMAAGAGAAGVGSAGVGSAGVGSAGVARRRFAPQIGLAFIALAVFMTLHVLNTMWPSPPALGDGAGAWESLHRVSCPVDSRTSTICFEVPNTAQDGKKYALIVDSGARTYARVQSHAIGRPLTRSDCVLLMFESTIGARLKLRQPLRAACALADSTDSTFALHVDPRLEHQTSDGWTPTRASEWLWPVWPFTAYQSTVLRVAGAVTFVMLAALMAGVAPWVIPAGYLVMLELVALLVGMRGPGWLEVGWTALGWAMALGIVQIDRWWRTRSAA